ncbi:MAG: putative Regulatory protein Crp [Schlesneria sp.]|nr:putative Regulatory protein Crp [Schlesneria sp.]
MDTDALSCQWCVENVKVLAMQILAQLCESFTLACGRIRSARRVSFKDKESVYIGREPGITYVIKRGYVRLVYVQPDGRPWTRMVFGKGALFGDLPFRPAAFLSEEQAVSTGASCVWEIEREELERHAEANADFQLLLLKTVSSQFQFLDRRIQWQLISPLRNRVAMALADLLCFAGGRCGHGHLVDVRLTHAEFSQFVVAARPAVSEILKEFKATGIIDYTRSYLCLLDLEALHAIAELAQK